MAARAPSSDPMTATHRSIDALAFAISALLDEERARQGLATVHLASRAKLSDGTVRAALDGRTVRTATFDAMATALGVTLTVTLVRPDATTVTLLVADLTRS